MINRSRDELKDTGTNSIYLLTHRNEWSLYQYLEDEFNCSGICRPGLFYFGNPTSYGPPEKTCLKQFLSIIRDQSHPFAIMSILTGVLSLIIFVLHFGLYNRPPADLNKPTLDEARPNINEGNQNSTNVPGMDPNG